MSDTQTKVIVGAAVAVGVTAASLAYLYSKREEPIPTKWKKVGELIDMNFFPVKSCGPVKQNSFDCHKLGIVNGDFFDRCFIISTNSTKKESKQVTSRTYPKLVLIKPKIGSDCQLTLTAPCFPDLILDLDDIRNGKPRKVTCWYSTVNAIDAGDKAAEWISEYTVGNKESLRLCFYPYMHPTKGRSDPDRKRYNAFTNNDAGTYHDSTSYMLINQASVDALNLYLDEDVKTLQFRPNFVINGAIAFSEDKWKWIRIGDEVIFRGIKPCTRCIFTNIDPESGERNPKHEPLETLIKKRSILPDDPPVMGLHMGIRITGRVSVGDAVYINDDAED